MPDRWGGFVVAWRAGDVKLRIHGWGFLHGGDGRLGGEGQTEDENAEVIGVDLIELGEGQGADTLSHLDGIAGAIVGLDEPILVARVAAEGGSFLHRVAAGFPHGLGNFLAAGREVIEVAPVDELALRVVGKGKAEVIAEGVAVDRQRLRLGERGGADIIPRGGGGKTHALFDAAGFLPAGGVLQVEIDAIEVGFPALREWNGGVIFRPLLCALVPGTAA